MRFDLSDEQRALRDSTRGLLDRHCPEATVREWAARPVGFDRALWARLAELGACGLLVPEDLGGVGSGPVEAGVVVGELGRALCPGPFLSSAVTATAAILHFATEASKTLLLPQLSSGTTVATVALTERGGVLDPESRAVAEGDGSGYRLTVARALVPDGVDADVVLVPARVADTHLALFAVHGSGESVKLRDWPGMDGTRRQAEMALAGAPATMLSAPGQDVRAGLELTAALSAACVAAYCLGGASRCLDITVDYAKVRTQFGVPIGAFQAVKHRCADMLIAYESAWASTYHALWQGQVAHPDFALSASCAVLFASEAYRTIAAGTIQVHGGIGFTWEHPAHLYFKRAEASAALLVDRDWHYERVNESARRTTTEG